LNPGGQLGERADGAGLDVVNSENAFDVRGHVARQSILSCGRPAEDRRGWRGEQDRGHTER